MSLEVRSEVELDRVVSLFRGLAHRNRLAICRELALEDRNVGDLVESLSLAQSTVSGHLSELRACGLIVGRRDGRQIVYSLVHDELLDLLLCAEHLLELAGEPVRPGLESGRVERGHLT